MHPHFEILCGAALPGAFPHMFFLLRRSTIVDDVGIIFYQMNIFCYQLQEPPTKLASWTLGNFGGYPKCLKWSSQNARSTITISESENTVRPTKN